MMKEGSALSEMPPAANTSKLPLSVFIIAKNEADRIVPVIESVRDWVDEVIVIDSGSEDGTVEVSEAAGARALYNPWPGYGEQKNFGENQCRNRWVLNLDADEIVTDTLAEEIKAIFRKGHEDGVFGYRVITRTVLPPFVRKKKRNYPFLRYVRLYHLDYGRFASHRVHDEVSMEEAHISKTSFDGVIDHYTIRGLSGLCSKINAYTDEQEMTLTPPKGIWKIVENIRIFFEFPLNFLKFYFMKRLFLYGMYGFCLAMTYAFGRFLRRAKLYEKGLKEEYKKSGSSKDLPISNPPGTRERTWKGIGRL
jgi:glycosyltransferase involved in cell wall biosynthesis